MLYRTKQCRICGKEKNLEEFRNQSSSKDGKKIYCKPCDSEYNKKNYRQNAEIRIDKATEWQKNNRDKVGGYQKTYRIKTAGPKLDSGPKSTDSSAENETKA